METKLRCFLKKRKVSKPHSNYKKIWMVILLIVISSFIQVFAATTGKIAGVVVQKSNGEPMPGVNIYLEGSPYGAATDVDGYYYILNVPPGTYTVVAQMVGFKKTKVTRVKVNVDLTTDTHFKLEEEILKGETIVVVAERPLIQKDLTSSAANISADEIAELPVSSFNEIIELQAGVVDGHFRGGRQGEVSYLIDGIPVNDPYDNSLSIEIENSSIQNLEVISGTFNAEYGQAMSGVINIVTKEGGNDYDFSANYYQSSHFTNHDKIFPELNGFGSNSANDFQFSLSGPLPVFKKLKFFITGRMNESDGHYFGPELYLPSDELFFMPSGDSSFVAQAPSERKSLHGKLTYYILPSLKVNYSYMMEDRFNRYYSHDYRLNPSGTKNHYNKAYNHSFILSHTFSNRTYYDLKFANSYNEYEGYVYKNPNDIRYLDSDNGRPSSGYTFRQGGNETDRYKRHTTSFLAKMDIYSQVNKIHKIGMGFQYKKHEVNNFWTSLDMENSAENDEIIY
ncbi:MAG: TonB-dependent receptor, partial [Calditrichia bacterium]|nr:TonB-dependent receptor [Calditrichia bacterium]